ncbi:MAG: hypothetical protein FD129_2339, partial [bacterium]
MIRLLLHGASGRMGKRIASRVAGRPGEFSLVGLVDARNPGECEAQLDAHPDAVVIDFSQPAAMPELLRILLRRPHPLVSGTTGLSEADRAG